jgi:hypothetical protein
VLEHEQLRALLERMRRTAEHMNRQSETPLDDLRGINASLAGLLLPHQRAEERSLYPVLAERLGGRDPLGAMSRMHEEIAREAKRFGTLVEGISCTAISRSEAHEVQRLLQVLDALIGVHLTDEEELLSNVEDLPVRP